VVHSLGLVDALATHLLRLLCGLFFSRTLNTSPNFFSRILKYSSVLAGVFSECAQNKSSFLILSTLGMCWCSYSQRSRKHGGGRLANPRAVAGGVAGVAVFVAAAAAGRAETAAGGLASMDGPARLRPAAARCARHTLPFALFTTVADAASDAQGS
jgi:hypothetical protein